MDIAQASASPPALPAIRREDYRPFAWLVPEVQLDFQLGLDKTQVKARLRVARNPDVAASKTIRLNGDGLALDALLLDGAPHDGHMMDGDDLVVALPGDVHELTITTTLDPAANTQLMGLYASSGMLCTQCEAEGFRRITFFPDRPDILSVYTVRMSALRDQFPILLCNGNQTGAGEDGEGRHYALWHDPWPKPAYLFALVAGDLVSNADSFVTMSGRRVALNVWVRTGDLERTGHAMEALKQSMRWDEQTFGREYDLDLYNIVAVSDFNMGAMENKGLNIFNTKYVLADPQTATDGDFDAVEGVIAHEYFHNWSGNRVTCRDWFQLSLKEGFTVLRDQLFSQDMGSAPVKRIEDVRILRSVQFPEDSGPLAHPIRPDSYREINNFYTATVYNKGAEVIRMMRTMAGEAAFRKACDLYFERHDGEAATCEDFIRAIEDGAGLDLGQFRLWYSQAGTPRVTMKMERSGDDIVLHLTQSTPATPGQDNKQPVPIPLRIALFDRASCTRIEEELIVLTQREQRITMRGTAKDPVLSVNRGFSAPVSIERAIGEDDLVFLAAHDDDPFARYEALQDLAVGHLLGAITGDLDESSLASGRQAIGEAMRRVLGDDRLDDLMRGELLVLPNETYLAEQMAQADPGAIHRERQALRRWLGEHLRDDLHQVHARACAMPFSLSAQARGARKVKTLALGLLASGDPALGEQLAAAQYDRADNMTDRQGALTVLVSLTGDERAAKLRDFYERFRGNDLVIDKWFALQASALHPAVIEHVAALATHPDFTLRNPNRVRSLFMALAANAHAFHAPGGAGYRMIADVILKLDPLNPQTAARFVSPLGRWRKIEPGRAALMRGELERIAAAPDLSRDTYEQVSRSLD